MGRTTIVDRKGPIIETVIGSDAVALAEAGALTSTTVALTGTALGGVDEDGLPGLTVIATISDGTWAATLGQNNQLTTDALAGLTSAQSETLGWNNEVRDNLIYSDLVRTSDTVATLTLPDDGRLDAYDITAQETITWIFPDSAYGETELFSDTFESGALGDSGRWQDIVGTGASIVTAASQGISAHGGTKVLRLGATGCAISHFVATDPGPGYSDLKLSCWIYRTTAWEQNNSGLRAGGLRGSEDQWGSFGVGWGTPGSCPDDPNNVNLQEFCFAYLFNDGAAWAQRVYTEWLDQTKLQESPPLCGGNYAQTGTPAATYYDAAFVPTVNAWHQYDIELQLNTVGQSNGWCKVWVDGVLKIAHLNVRYRTTSALQLWAVTFDTGTVLAGQYYVDDVVVTTRNP